MSECLEDATSVSRVTIADVAAAAGVSKTAVSFAFNSPEKLAQTTLERVLGVAGNLGYAPYPAARALSMRRSGTIGVLIPQRLSTIFANPFLSELIQGLGELCEEHDLNMLLVPPLAGSLEGAIRRASVDGFIGLGLSPNDLALEMVERLGIPTVLVDSVSSSLHPSVNVDDQGGAEAAAQHLLDLGHRDVVIIELPPTRGQAGLTPTASRRLAGYHAALDRAGAPKPHSMTAVTTMAAGARAFETLPKGEHRPTGVLAMSDTVAIGVMAAAQSAGLKVPDDLSVVGYDDLPMAAWTNPGLTTVHQPIIEKGRVAARLLIQRLQGKSVEPPPPLRTSLVIRGSTKEVNEEP